MHIRAGATIAVVFAVAAGLAAQTRGGTPPVPAFQADPFWPKPLPNHWILGSVTGVAVDSRDHVWVVHRGIDSLNTRTESAMGLTPPGAEECCLPAPPVLEFDPAGNLVSSWGGPGQGYDWPQTPGGIAIDPQGNVWIAAAGWPEPAAARGGGAGGRAGAGRTGGAGAGAAGAGATPAATPAPPPRPYDAHLLKFSAKGQFLKQYGTPGSSDGSNSKTLFNRPANLDFDASANEVYVADGYGNHRVVVLDAATGAYKRHWGAYGAAPADAAEGAYDPATAAAKQFRAVTCVTLAKDGMVYVCDRTSDRVQVFDKAGKFVKEATVSKAALGNGSVWDIALSSDTQQRYLFVANGQEHTVLVLDRASLQTIGSIGTGGRIPGRFMGVGSVAMDSRGNLFTGETFEGKRVQKFTPGR
jgi:DNA-binding beta-propeller fold protein YncE